MRKIIAAALVLMCLLGACSKPPERDNVGTLTYVGVCMADGDQAPYRNALEKELLRLGYYVNFSDAEGDQSRQHDHITAYIAQQYDILIVEPVMTVAADGILTRLKAAGMPVVLVGKEPPDGVLDLWWRACYVGFDKTRPGQIQGQIILNTPEGGDVNGDGQVAYAILAGPEDHTDTLLHTENCIATLSAGADAVLLSTVYGDNTQARGKALTEGLLSAYGRDIEVLFCGSDDVALGALEALKAYGRTVSQDIYVVGIGGSAEILSMVRQGTLTGTAMTDYDALGRQAAEAASLMLTHDAKQIYTVDYVLKEAP